MHFPLSVLLLSKCVHFWKCRESAKMTEKSLLGVGRPGQPGKKCAELSCRWIFFKFKKWCFSLFPGGWLTSGRAARGRGKKEAKWGCCRSRVSSLELSPSWVWSWGMWDCVRMCVHCPAALVFECGRGTQGENYTCWINDEWLAGFGIWDFFSVMCGFANGECRTGEVPTRHTMAFQKLLLSGLFSPNSLPEACTCLSWRNFM